MPYIPLVVEGLMLPMVALATLAGLAGQRGLLPEPLQSAVGGWAWLLVVAAFVAKTRLTGTDRASQTAGMVSREDHVARLKETEIVAQRPGPMRMKKATASNTFRIQQIQSRDMADTKEARLDLSSFCHVIEVNTEEGWCDLEGPTTFETFVAETAKHGWMPLVVPELKTITVGGSIVGIGIESSSFKHGFVHEGLLEADILVASGKVITASPTNEYADLFAALPNSLGSFGYLLRLRMRIQPTKPLVEINKVWHDTPEKFIDALAAACDEKQGHDFVDGVAISEQGGMVITGDFVDVTKGGAAVSHYIYTQYYPSLTEEGVDYMEVTEYIWRWDADWFWVSQIFPLMGWYGMRWLTGAHYMRSDVYKVFNNIVMLLVAPLTRNQELVIQDIEVPCEKSAEWIRVHLECTKPEALGKIKLKSGSCSSTPGKLGVPIWICPVIGTGAPLMPMAEGKLYMNFGFWDACEGGWFAGTLEETRGGNVTAKINRKLEEMCKVHGAKKTLYSSIHMDEAEFREEYNGEHYRKIKEKYDQTGRLRPLYDRLTRA
jgi:FAD/FMN-containing dehydrogenase